ncbi:hypothetical protein HUZ36_11845 [Pseudoalteromonas sp. McH1-7]|uniref:hypothetical protein n=1 Tax=Pseudoalteromonas TaxID=53246 RepID=UPI001590CAAD|nr:MULTISPECIES: hypothetical protein [Pseudoalteromonas]MDW7549806.1 hypothetical protein [Pseudoalteromonas peptidolytica]NUZ11470.1 hypothetical protein [Pseudoalteromonas sp. McH1-7]
MKNKTLVNFLLSTILLGLLVSSSPNFAHLSPEQQSGLIVANPTSYFQIAPKFKLAPEHATDKLLNTIARLQQPNWEFERLKRILDASQMIKAELFLLDAWGRFSQTQRQALLHDIVKQGAFDTLQALSTRYTLSEEFTTLLQVWRGKPVSSFSQSALLAPFQLSSQMQWGSQSCQFTLALIASDLKGLHHLQVLKRAFELRPEPKRGVYCLSRPIYVAEKLNCEKYRGFATCKLQNSDTFAHYDHLVLMARDGLANVRHHTMTLTPDSTYNTFIHELMHFSGFEDEYPVATEKAKWLCANSGHKAPNLYVGEQAPNNWVPSRTCEHGKLPSYKPSKVHSLLEYQSIKLNETYRKKWLLVLNSQRSIDNLAVNSAE